MKIAIIGLGYVGLPLAIEFGKCATVIGFDISLDRIHDLSNNIDSTNEVTQEDLANTSVMFTADEAKLIDANYYIVTVPTPVDAINQPDLMPLKKASNLVGKNIKKDDIVIYESTVYPGATEEVCIPILEEVSGLVFNQDFFAGYSPERINPGDKIHRLADIKKVTSGSTPETAILVDQLYQKIITAGTFRATSIKVAEAAKVIENTQRDINIALINELAIIFDILQIDTNEVLEAAGTKWNFLPFTPGMVGGHCIGVDPYYLTYKAQEVGYRPELILAGRSLNDGMSKFIAAKLIKEMLRKEISIKHSKILILGVTFKENCPDTRNSKVVDLMRELDDYGCTVDVADPMADPTDLYNEYGITLTDPSVQSEYDGIILSVSHKQFIESGLDFYKPFLKATNVIFDLQNIFPADRVDLRL